MRFHIPIRLPSLPNTRMSWQALASLKKKQKRATTRAMSKCMTVPIIPLLVTITRVGPRRLDDDNLEAASKYVRDAIADKIGLDDGSPLYTWRYEQRVGDYGIDVEITPR
jgi:hypothetical protein